MRGPLQSLVSDTGAFAEAAIALQRISDLGLTLTKEIGQPNRTLRREMRDSSTLSISASWESLALRDIEYRYDGGHPDDDFALGPVDIDLRPGEIIFVSGGNGSGKTTLLKVLTGLYTPTKGQIFLDTSAVNETNVRIYRTKFAVVFSDFCLFEQVADLHFEELSVEAERVAKRFRLKPWMLAPRRSNDASAKLSAGERRRAALLTALLDDRPILVFDEWAADQDPQYKDLFYREILPSMRARGKLVIVLSHDERYFHLGDRVLWLERAVSRRRGERRNLFPKPEFRAGTRAAKLRQRNRLSKFLRRYQHFDNSATDTAFLKGALAAVMVRRAASSLDRR